MGYPAEVSAPQRALIEQHLDLVLQANKTLNLTRIANREEAELLHIEDSLVGLPECQQAPEGRYADIGSGGGFPGFPLAIVTGRQTLLVESVKKKAEMLEAFAEQLGLSSQVSVYAGRTEELAGHQPEAFSLITARALTALPSLLELASPLLQQGGWLVAYKSDNVDDELEGALGIQDKLGMVLRSDRHVLLSDGSTPRRILVFEKVSEPQVKLPRRPGMAQKRPYKA